MAYIKILIFSFIFIAVQVASSHLHAQETASPVEKLLQEMKPDIELSDLKENSQKSTSSLTLDAALANSYLKNPRLQAARAELRAVDEEYAQAASGLRPSLNGSAAYTSSRTDDSVQTTSGDPKTLSLEITQPLYRGGSTLADILTSENRIKAQRALLASAEQEILLESVISYMDVLRDQEIVRLRENNVRVLSEQLSAAKERFRLGDLTKTDVSQSEARLANALAEKVTAEGDLNKSRALFEKTVGLQADNLIVPHEPTVKNPQSLEEALAQSDTRNPDLLYARYLSNAAQSTTESIRGEFLPQLDLEGSMARTYDTTNGDSREDSRTIGLRATIPIFSGGGSTYSRLRQSRQIETQRKRDITTAERETRERVIDAWEERVATAAEKQARLAQIAAAKTALEGVKLESDFGARTTLDLLDAEQEYLDAQVAHIISARDHTVAAYSLLSAAGLLTAEYLQLQTQLYDVDKNFQNVKNRWFGGRIETEE